MKTSIDTLTMRRNSFRRNFPENSDRFGLQIAFVLFFLAVEIGQVAMKSLLESGVLSLAFLAVMIAPELIKKSLQKEFVSSMFQRLWIGVFGILVGLGIATSTGFPELLPYLPMTLLIISASIMCYTSFYSLLKIRIAR